MLKNSSKLLLFVFVLISFVGNVYSDWCCYEAESDVITLVDQIDYARQICDEYWVKSSTQSCQDDAPQICYVGSLEEKLS